MAAADDRHREEIQGRDSLLQKLRRKLQETRTPSGSSVDHGEIVQMKHDLALLEGEVRKKTEAEQKLKGWQRKYGALKQKYVALNSKIRDLTIELDQMKNSRESNHRQIEEEESRFRMERQQFEGRLRQAEETLANERDRGDGMRERLKKSDEELGQLRCVLKILANNDRKLQRLGLENENVLEGIRDLGGKIDRVGRAVSPQRRAATPKRKPKRSSPKWRAFRDF
jgi:chromosome segregation ATPase